MSYVKSFKSAKKIPFTFDYGSMRNYNPPLLGWPDIPWVLEIRLCRDSWAKIKKVAQKRKTTYSRVVRYALFRLIRRKGLRKYLGLDGGTSEALKKYLTLNARAKERRPDFRLKHRHILCLYGEDEILVRLAAVELRCSMTHLVRLALEYRLEEMLIAPWGSLDGVKFKKWAWVILGSKLYQEIEFPIGANDERRFIHVPFEKNDYW